MDMRYDGAERGGTEFAISGGCLSNAQTAPWSDVCVVDDILPGTGVCALVADRHVAVFRTGDDQFFAIDNVDPKSGASVLARGLMGSLGGRVVGDSPL
jgi:nitrite reductase (NADH) small subunit